MTTPGGITIPVLFRNADWLLVPNYFIFKRKIIYTICKQTSPK